MVLLWFLLMLILPPLYYPYPRLMLPFVIAFQIPFAFLMINSMMHSFNYSTEKLPPNQRTKLVVWALNLPSNPGATMLLAVTALILTISKFPTIDAVFEMPSLDGRTSLSVTTSNLVKTVIPNGDPNAPVIVYVYGEPAVYWHLSRQQVLAGPVSDLEFANSETRPAGVSLYLVTGPHAGQTPAFATQMEAKKDLFEEVGKFYYEPSLLIKMDEVGGDPKAKKIETLTLWKVK